MIAENNSEKTQKKLRFIGFTAKWLVIGAVLFFVLQLAFGIFLVKPNEEHGVTGDFLWHNYCGTFFVTNTVENTYLSENAYKEYSKAVLEEKENGATAVADAVVSYAVIPAAVICLLIALNFADKNRLFSKHTSRWLLASGIMWAAANVYVEIHNCFSLQKELPYLTGVPATARYYCQLYAVLGIPALIIACALILRQHERNLRGESTKNNSKILTGYAVSLCAVSLSFTAYRFCVRSYELIMCLTFDDYSVRLPFYHKCIELPYYLAASPYAYSQLTALRLVKDLPVFWAAGLTAVMLASIMFDVSKDRINTQKNVQRFTLCIISLLASSLFFNVLGIFEVSLLNNSFSEIYGDVTYTIGIRSLCEPALYAVVLWFMMTFVRAAEKTN